MTTRAQQLTPFDLALPRKRMAASQLFLEQSGRVLVVNPTHQDHWELPGGAVEANESPRQSARRDVAEELCVGRAAGASSAWTGCRPGPTGPRVW